MSMKQINHIINKFTRQEVIDIIIADIVLTFAFSFYFSTGFGGIFSTNIKNFTSNFLIYFPISIFVITISFVLHELMHKFVAQYYGAIAGFKTSLTGLVITILSSLFGFLIGIPGATMIYAHNFDKKQEGIVSLAGPLTNFTIFAIFILLNFIFNPKPSSYFATFISLTFFINILLALFNMLPIFPLDGSKIFAWNKKIYVSMMAVIFILAYIFIPSLLSYIIFMIVFALIFSLFYKHILF